MRLHQEGQRRAGQHLAQAAAEVAEADDADLGPGQQARAGVAVAAPELAPLAEGKVGLGHAPEQVQREGEPKLGHRAGKDGAGGDDVDAAPEQFGIGHVVDQVRLDVQHRPQAGKPHQRQFRQRRLAEDVARLAQHVVRQRVQRVGTGLHHLVSVVQAGAGGGGEDQIEAARFGRSDDDGLGHGVLRLAAP